jgi:hypothetical protein
MAQELYDFKFNRQNMTDRRDFMGYIGTGVVGSIIGYYAGAQKLLGIQSEQTPRRNPEEPTEESVPHREPCWLPGC